jgi:spore maturation protein SpmA
VTRVLSILALITATLLGMFTTFMGALYYLAPHAVFVYVGLLSAVLAVWGLVLSASYRELTP